MENESRGLAGSGGADGGLSGRIPVRLDILQRLKDMDIDLMSDLSIKIERVPEGALLSAGKNNWDGNWSLTPIHLTDLTFTAPPGGPDEYTLTVRVLSIDSDGYGVATTVALFDLTIPASGDAQANETPVPAPAPGVAAPSQGAASPGSLRPFLSERSSPVTPPSTASGPLILDSKCVCTGNTLTPSRVDGTS